MCKKQEVINSIHKSGISTKYALVFLRKFSTITLFIVENFN